MALRQAGCPRRALRLGLLAFFHAAGAAALRAGAPNTQNVSKESFRGASTRQTYERILERERAEHQGALRRFSEVAAAGDGVGAAGPDGDRPRVFFLVMVSSGFGREDLWQAFFDGADKRKYRIFMHCAVSAVCYFNFQAKNELGITLVDTVPSIYCEDLVSPMAQLLKAATQESTSAGDKFVFVSESTLPVKPFSVVYGALTADQDSEFCVASARDWGRPRAELSGDKHALLVKHSQWVVLSREHALTVVRRWPGLHAGRSHFDTTWNVPLLSGAESGGVGEGGEHASFRLDGGGFLNHGPKCADEWAIFASIYGALPDRDTGKPIKLPGFRGGLLHTSGLRANHKQGGCSTFSFWSGSQDPDAAELAEAIAQESPGSKLSCYPKCKGTHPAVFDELSDKGATHLRSSPFLFARKFLPGSGVPSLSQFRGIILADDLDNLP